ncbi:glycosyltransferase [Breznakiella homolactica]|uniref:Glycosyltransferase family 1 protein n=1 Tax=Breznakiella homolactica TaxID=2798577 RepID=A0A7T7XQX5_9SPIR|nr:glycosyltransferase [Breznakiella homolactica]QQO10840.1 glycosyltransferase [Breznakiella homolactica]
MKIFLITRGSQGDIYPYLALADALVKQGHEITISLPRVFEKFAQAFNLNYTLQNYDDISTLLETTTNNRDLLAWMQRVTEQQFEEFIPILEKHDILVATNTEFSAPSIAEYCGKPLIRTAYAPFIPGKKIPPPVMPWPYPNPVVTPKALWNMLNLGINVLTKNIINKNRKKRGMSQVKDLGDHAPGHAHNYLMYSPSLGNTDPAWKYTWDIGGYCFNDMLPFEQEEFDKLADFVNKDSKPTLFFTLGSCKTKKKDLLCEWLLDICSKRGYKFVVGSGWWQTGATLAENAKNQDMYLLDGLIPHCRIFPLFDVIIHHGGCGTTHSASRAGKPQMVMPLFVDQHYWGKRVHDLGIGPRYGNVSRITRAQLETKVNDLIENSAYRKNAADLQEKIRGEHGVQALCSHIVRVHQETLSRKYADKTIGEEQVG